MAKSRKEEWRIQIATARHHAHDVMMKTQKQLETGGAPIALDMRPVRFEPIDEKAHQAFKSWKENSGFPWIDVATWKQKYPRAFHVALWYGMTLCGLCFAKPNKSTLVITVILLEGNPNVVHPLKGNVAALMLLAITQYAKLLGSTQIEIQAPSPGALPHYYDLDFKYVGTRLVRTIE